MKRRSLLQGLALLLPGAAAAPALAKAMVEEVVVAPPPAVAPEPPLEKSYELIDVVYDDLELEVMRHPQYTKFNNQEDFRPPAHVAQLAAKLMKEKLEAAIREGKRLRLVFFEHNRRPMPGSPSANPEGYYYVGGAGIRYLADEIVLEDYTGNEIKVIKSRRRQIG